MTGCFFLFFFFFFKPSPKPNQTQAASGGEKGPTQEEVMSALGFAHKDLTLGENLEPSLENGVSVGGNTNGKASTTANGTSVGQDIPKDPLALSDDETTAQESFELSSVASNAADTVSESTSNGTGKCSSVNLQDRKENSEAIKSEVTSDVDMEEKHLDSQTNSEAVGKAERKEENSEVKVKKENKEDNSNVAKKENKKDGKQDDETVVSLESGESSNNEADEEEEEDGDEDEGEHSSNNTENGKL